MAAQTFAAGFGYRLGRSAKCAVRGYLRRERQVMDWLVAEGVPAFFVKVLLWGIKLTLLGLLFFAAFSFVVLLSAALAAALYVGRDTDMDEWPFMTSEELRKAPGYDPNLYNDSSHEEFADK